VTVNFMLHSSLHHIRTFVQGVGLLKSVESSLRHRLSPTRSLPSISQFPSTNVRRYAETFYIHILMYK